MRVNEECWPLVRGMEEERAGEGGKPRAENDGTRVDEDETDARDGDEVDDDGAS